MFELVEGTINDFHVHVKLLGVDEVAKIPVPELAEFTTVKFCLPKRRDLVILMRTLPSRVRLWTGRPPEPL